MPSQSIVVIVIIVFFGVIAAHLTALRLINSHATSLYQKRNATDLKSYLEKSYVRRLMPAYNHGCLMLAACDIAGDASGVQEVIDDLLDIAAPGAQRNDLAARAINYYVSKGNSPAAHSFVNQLRIKGEATLFTDCKAIRKPWRYCKGKGSPRCSTYLLVPGQRLGHCSRVRFINRKLKRIVPAAIGRD